MISAPDLHKGSVLTYAPGGSGKLPEAAGAGGAGLGVLSGIVLSWMRAYAYATEATCAGLESLFFEEAIWHELCDCKDRGRSSTRPCWMRSRALHGRRDG